MFLLSDGVDDYKEADVRLKDYINNLSNNKNIFTINSFGFGEDHDPVAMSNIAKLKNGTFFYLPNINKVVESFLLMASYF